MTYFVHGSLKLGVAKTFFCCVAEGKVKHPTILKIRLSVRVDNFNIIIYLENSYILSTLSTNVNNKSTIDIARRAKGDFCKTVIIWRMRQVIALIA